MLTQDAGVASALCHSGKRHKASPRRAPTPLGWAMYRRIAISLMLFAVLSVADSGNSENSPFTNMQTDAAAAVPRRGGPANDVPTAKSTAESTKVQKSVNGLQTGRRIQVTLVGGRKMIGHLGNVEADRFVLEPDASWGTPRVLRYDEVRSVRTKMTRTRQWLLVGGIVWACLTAMGAML